MIVGACEAWLRDYRMDGLRFDSIKDVPMDMVQVGAVILLLCLLLCYIMS
jgi:1,4-alpha-glucan branching enzyme